LIKAFRLYQDFEVIVVNNTNANAVFEVVKEYQDEINISCVREDKKGISYARNKGIHQAKGEIVAFVDDDAWVDESWLYEIDTVFKETNIAACGGKITPVFTQSLPSWISRWGLSDYHGIIISHNLGDEQLDYTTDIALPFTTNIAIRKEILTKYGGFKTDLSVCEDMEMSQRLLSAGERIIYNPKMVVFHIIEPYRLSKLFYLRWHFRAGFNNTKISVSKGKVNILGLPGYFLRNLFLHFIRIFGYAFILNSKEVFTNLLWLAHDFGFILGKAINR
jgi:cellulose synthase/poly-beta-1,6-N-acetylglucosamine synthase-like glycosyltransferase